MNVLLSPGAQQRRFAAYLDRLAAAAEHLDRVEPLKSYCMGLLLPGERKSVEPLAARLAPNNVRQAHPSLHHIIFGVASHLNSSWESKPLPEFTQNP